jgi:hypothetical protein
MVGDAFDYLSWIQELDLFGGAVHNHDSDVQGTQESDIEEYVGEVLVCDDTCIHCDNERLSRNCGTYWRIARRSVSFTVTPVAIWPWADRSPHSGRPRARPHGNHVPF